MNLKIKTLAIGIGFLGVLGTILPPAVAEGQVEAALRVLQAKTAKGVVDFAESKKGTKVGGGDSTELIAAALQAASAEPGKTNVTPYVWGTPLTGPKGETRVMPRAFYIIQMEGCVFKEPTGPDLYDVREFKRHTAIIKSVSGTSFVVLHQGLNPKKSAVVETTLDLAWLTAGDYRLYVPIPAPKPPATPDPVKTKTITLTSLEWEETLEGKEIEIRVYQIGSSSEIFKRRYKTGKLGTWRLNQGPWQITKNGVDVQIWEIRTFKSDWKVLGFEVSPKSSGAGSAAVANGGPDRAHKFKVNYRVD